MMEFKVGVGVPETLEGRVYALAAMHHAGMGQVPTALAVEIAKDLCRARYALNAVEDCSAVIDWKAAEQGIEIEQSEVPKLFIALHKINRVTHHAKQCHCAVSEFEKP